MLIRLVLIVLALWFAAFGARAATLTVSISDEHGKPVANTIIFAAPKSGKAPDASRHLPAKKS